MQNELSIAQQNNHNPGHIFEGLHDQSPVCFCKDCNAPLVYVDPKKQTLVGFYNSKCEVNS